MSPDHTASRRFDIRRLEHGASTRVIDSVAVEEPLQISIGYHFKGAFRREPLASTMRTPGADQELAAGFLLAEGLIRNNTDLVNLRSIGAEPSNEVLAELSQNVDVETWRSARTGFVTASCGICGKTHIEAIRTSAPPLSRSGPVVKQSTLVNLPALLRDRQSGFAETGGLHAAALADADGNIQAVFEDIGRHNALDKLIGRSVLNESIPLQDSIAFVSSRSSFELVQKAAMAGIPILASVGGPSSLAIQVARDCGLTLVGFVRGDRCNVYSGEWRITP